jgi:hypothetical protein
MQVHTNINVKKCNVGSLTSHNPIGLQGLLRDSFTFLYLSSQVFVIILYRSGTYVNFENG